MTKPHTLTLVVVESSVERKPRVSALSMVLGERAVSLAHSSWRNEAPTLKPGYKPGLPTSDYGFALDPWILG